MSNFRKPRAAGAHLTGLLASTALVALTAGPAAAQAVIDNGVIALGVQPQGNLIVEGGGFNGVPVDTSPISEIEFPDIGLTFIPTLAESLAPGCFCEGWGIADLGTGFFARAGEDFGDENISSVVFSTSGTGSSPFSFATATSTVTTGLGSQNGYDLSITHDFAPAPETPNLFRVDVTIANTGSTPVARLVYRRAMDWDVPPTEFFELVTIGGTATSTAYLNSSDDGFVDGNPHVPLETISPDAVLGGDFVDSGPADHGAVFDFDFGALPVGEEVTFIIYYGAAATEAEAFAALTAVEAEVFSFGQPAVGIDEEESPGDPLAVDATVANTTGLPNTFIFAFAGVGGTPISAPPGAVDLFLNVYRDLQEVIMQNHAGAVASFNAGDTGSAMVYEVERQLSQGATVVEDAWGIEGFRVYLTGDYQFGDFDRDGNNAGFDYDGGGGSIGADYTMPAFEGGQLTVGGSVGYHVLGADVDVTRSTLDVDAVSGTLYAAVKMPDGLHGQLQLGLGHFSYDQVRDPFGAAGGPFRASPDGFAVSIDAEAGYEFEPVPLGENLSLVVDPFAGIGYQHRSVEGFQESGGGVRVASFSDDSLYLRAGSRFTLAHETPEARVFAFLEGALSFDVLDDDETAAINLGALAAEAIDPVDSLEFQLRAALGADLADGVRGLVQYQGGFAADSIRHAFSLRAEIAF